VADERRIPATSPVAGIGPGMGGGARITGAESLGRCER
jgi:hypothetical protein